MAHFHWTLLLSGVRFYNLANGRSKISILSWALQRLLRFIMTKQLRKRLYGPHLWIADNTVPSFLFLYRLKVYRLSPNGEYIRGWVTSGSGGTTIYVEDIVNTLWKHKDFVHNWCLKRIKWIVPIHSNMYRKPI